MSAIAELIEKLNIEANGYKSYRSERAIRVKHLLRKAAETIETLSAKVRAANMERSTAYYNGGWIPVSERTPEHGGEYLLWGKICDDDDEEYCFMGDYDEFEEKFGIEKSNYDPHTLGFLDTEIDEYCSVIAWIPLPEPYREDGET